MAVKASGVRSKTIYQLDTPFKPPNWPETSTVDQDIILDMLCDLISPVGDHRRQHTISSKGKRSKKRKRAEAAMELEAAGSELQEEPPSILRHLTVGFNSTNRHLEAITGQLRRPDIILSPLDISPGDATSLDTSKPTPFAAVFVSKPSYSSPLFSHLPLQVQAANMANSSQAPTRLISLPRGADARLTAALGLPRANIIGLLHDAPHAGPLIACVRECVPEIDVPWLEPRNHGRHLPMQINAIQTTAPVPAKAAKGSGGAKGKKASRHAPLSVSHSAGGSTAATKKKQKKK